MATLNELRQMTRDHMDVDDVELSNVLLDMFAREGSSRIEKHVQAWSFREHIFRFQTTAGPGSYPYNNVSDPDRGFMMRKIVGIWSENGPLKWLGPQDAMSRGRLRLAAPGVPTAWYEYGGQFHLLPAPEVGTELIFQGVREPRDWVLEGSGGEPDFPPEFHNTVWLWMLGRAYGQQEDTELSMMYMDLFQDELERLAKDYEMMPPPQPTIMSGLSSRPNISFGGMRYDWE